MTIKIESQYQSETKDAADFIKQINKKVLGDHNDK